ncbi:MAG: bacteriohemerythrin [Campylobacteraceae bacterium]|jgi:hemerythrin|nr:bacteriohemerythrin [Campylobacteraceae bacterium]
MEKTIAYWNWDSSYELGIDVIDRQHKRIVRYINDLHDVLKTNDKDKIASTIEGITDYTVSHFAYEESLMERANYPLLEENKQIHESFIKTVEKYKWSFREGRDIAGQLMAELQIWLTYHILNEDKDYAQSIINMFAKTSQNEELEKNKKKSWFAKLLGF